MLFSSFSLLSYLADAPQSGAMSPLLLGCVMGYFAAATLSVTALSLSAGPQSTRVPTRAPACVPVRVPARASTRSTSRAATSLSPSSLLTR